MEKNKLLISILFFTISIFILNGCNNSYSKINSDKNLIAFPSSSKYYSNHSYSNKIKWGFIDKTGKVIVKPKYDRALDSSDGLAVILLNGKYGYINSNGEIAIKPKFEQAFSFKNGVAEVAINNKAAYINKAGKFIVKPKYTIVSHTHNKMIVVAKDNKYGFGSKSIK